MIAKIAVLFAVVAVAYAGVLVSPPASTTLLANHVVAAPVAYTAHHVAAPIAYSAPAVVASPQIIHTGNKIVHTVEPVEQHGYRIAY